MGASSWDHNKQLAFLWPSKIAFGATHTEKANIPLPPLELSILNILASGAKVLLA